MKCQRVQCNNNYTEVCRIPRIRVRYTKKITQRQTDGAGILEMDWKAYRLPGLKFNSRSYGRNLL